MDDVFYCNEANQIWIIRAYGRWSMVENEKGVSHVPTYALWKMFESNRLILLGDLE